MSVHFKSKKSHKVTDNDNKADRSTINETIESNVTAIETMADVIAGTEAGDTLMVEAQAHEAEVETRHNQLVSLVKFVFETHPEQTGKKWNIRRDVLKTRTQYLRWIAEGKTRLSYDTMVSALKQANTGVKAYAEVCQLLDVPQW